MKYENKYPNAELLEIHNGIMKSLEKHECCNCGALTNFVDVLGEVYVCSEECEHNIYRQLWEGPDEF